MDVKELRVRKIKSGYEVCDKYGNTAKGITKDMAISNYKLIFDFEQPNITLDISKFNVNI